MNKKQMEMKLFPRQFRIVGFGLLILTLIFFFLRVFEVFEMDKKLVLQLCEISILISLMTLSMTRGKIEDELSMRIRLRAFTAAILFGTLTYILSPFIELITEGEFLAERGSFHTLVLIYFFYFLMVFILKRGYSEK